MNDDQKHENANSADEEIQDEESPLGSSTSSEPEDIDKTLEGVGLPNDDQGPKELNSEDVIDNADKNQN